MKVPDKATRLRQGEQSAERKRQKKTIDLSANNSSTSPWTHIRADLTEAEWTPPLVGNSRTMVKLLVVW